MRCEHCRQENPPGAKFCNACGHAQALACVACRNANPPGSLFCNECGRRLEGVTASPRFESPQTYTPGHLAEKILTSRDALEGERKQVTVLFADLKGSMELLADRDPEEARGLLDPVLERMMEAVHHYEGTVNQVMGDGIMALFGAPLAHEDHAVRACYAALRMQEAVKRYAQAVRRAEAVSIQIRVGLNSGEVVVRSIGSDLRMDYTAVGQTTHLAARMEQLATPGSVLITADGLRLAEGYVQVAPLGPVNVKGLTEPVEVYEVTGIRAVRTRLQAAASRGLTRFVGRDAELEQLRRALGLAGDGHGQLAAIVGEPGVGKSRLVYEFAHSHRTRDWLILESGSVSYGKATSYLPVIDLLKAYFRIQDRDDHREIREKAIGKLLALDRALEPLLPAFLWLLDVPVDAPEWQALDPSQRRQRARDAVKRMLLRESQVQPLLVIFEDLHWIDSETQAFLDNLVESLPAARILLLVNYRPEYQHGWSRKTYYGQLRLDTLPAESAEELLHALLGGDTGLAPLRQHLIARTGGNPFFLEESVRTLVETGTLVGERGSYLLAHPATSVQVPATVQAILAARIDRLPGEDKQLLQAASVVGKDIPFALLQAIAELPEDALRRVLTALQGAEFLYESRLFPDLEYTFKHALTHEVAYGSLLQERRRLLHARIMDAIETLHAGRLAEHVERLGQHAFRGEVWDKAFQYLRQAGVKAFDRSASREAVACLEQALVALDRLPESRATLEQAIDLRFDLRSAFLAVGDLDRALAVLREAEPLAERLEDRGRLGWISGYLANVWTLRGDYRRGVELGERAFAIAEAVADPRLRIVASSYLGFTHLNLGDYRRSIAHLRRTVESIDPELIGQRFGMALSPFAWSWAQLAQCHAELGEFAEGLACARESLRVAEIAIQPFNRIFADLAAGHLYCRKGEGHRAIPPLEHAVALCQSTGIRLMNPVAAALLGEAYALSGRTTDALPLLAHAVEEHASMGTAIYRSYALAGLGHAYLLAGRGAEALERARQALEFSRSHGERGWEAFSLRILGEICSHPDHADGEAAESSYRSALALADELGMRPLAAHCHLGLGKLYRRTGKGAEAQEHLTTATTMYREMDMPFWLEGAEAELTQLVR